MVDNQIDGEAFLELTESNEQMVKPLGVVNVTN